MRLVTFDEIQKNINSYARVIALDISASSIGVAMGSLSLKVATPLKTFKRASLKADAAALGAILKDYPTDLWVIGYPLNMDGTEGARCQSVKDTATELMKHLPEIPILFWDERLSTEAGDKMVDEYREKLGTLTNKSGKKALAAKDHLAAKAILESFFDEVR
jgi:putative Holliday junction resolvase